MKNGIIWLQNFEHNIIPGAPPNMLYTHSVKSITLLLTRDAKREAAPDDPSELVPDWEDPEAPPTSDSGLFRCPMAASAVWLAAALSSWAALSCWI